MMTTIIVNILKQGGLVQLSSCLVRLGQ